jgi:hypothetical protein
MTRFVFAALLALGGCSAQEADIMPGGSKETLYDRLVGIREVQNSAGQIIKSTDGKGIFRLTPGTGIELAFNPTKESYEISQGVGGVLSVPTTRTITVGPGLTIDGGGSADLSANRSIAFPGPISSSQHGTLPGGTLHVDASPVAAGFMPASMFSALGQKLSSTPILTTDATINTNDYDTVLVDCSGGNVTITLDDTNWTNGYKITVKMAVAGGGNILRIVQGSGNPFEDGNINIDITQNLGSVTFQIDTTDYSPNNPLGQAWIVGSYKYP